MKPTQALELHLLAPRNPVITPRNIEQEIRKASNAPKVDFQLYPFPRPSTSKAPIVQPSTVDLAPKKKLLKRAGEYVLHVVYVPPQARDPNRPDKRYSASFKGYKRLNNVLIEYRIPMSQEAIRLVGTKPDGFEPFDVRESDLAPEVYTRNQ